MTMTIPRLALLLLSALATIGAFASAHDCPACSYTVFNCSTTKADSANGQPATTTTSTPPVTGTTELRREPANVDTVQVCDAEGRIQVDDVFCDSEDCQCAEGKRCVSLVLGCRNIFQARSRKRCLGEDAVQQRFDKCAKAQALTAQTHTNLDSDWVHFKKPKACKSDDCHAVRRFHQCGAVQCGYLVVAWREDRDKEWRFVVDGSRSSDMAAGTFLFTANMASTRPCETIQSRKIDNCYSLQTRNQKNGACDGIYFQVDTALKAQGETFEFSKLPPSIWYIVMGSIFAATVAVAIVVVVYVRLRRAQHTEEAGDLLRAASSTNEEDEGDVASTEHNVKSRLGKASQVHELRQRPNSPSP